MALSNFPNSFNGGALIKNIPMFDVVDGNVYWVDSAYGGTAVGSFNSPYTTIQAAVNACATNNGDRIYCKSGHQEDLASAGALTCSVAGVTIQGIGYGSAQAQLTFITAATASVVLSAASVRFVNMRFTAGFADVGAVGTGAIDINASGAEFLSCRFDESTTDLNYIVVMSAVTGADDIKVIDCDYVGADASNDFFIELAGAHSGCRIQGNRMTHSVAQTAGQPFIKSGGALTNVLIEENYMHTETADIVSSYVVLTGTASNGWFIGNQLSCIDTDADAAKVVTSLDITGLHSSGNFFSSTVDSGYGIESFFTIDDLA